MLNIYQISIANLALYAPVTNPEKIYTSSYKVYISYKIKEFKLFVTQIFQETFLLWAYTEETMSNPVDKIPKRPRQVLPCNPLARLSLTSPAMKMDSITKGDAVKGILHGVKSEKTKNMAFRCSGWWIL